jgi:RNA polymerase Rpb1, domain 4
MVAGSKGSVCVGQQSAEDRQIPFSFHHRTLTHFATDDFSPEAREFVRHIHTCVHTTSVHG